MRIEELRQRLRDFGAKPEHLRQILRAWVSGQPIDRSRHRSEHYHPLSLRRAMPGLRQEFESLAAIHSEHPGADDSARLLVRLKDGQTIESVLLPREGVCISSQAGCAVGCAFCMTGRLGLLRQLGSAEIVAQVALARRRRNVRRVVFMGMGESSHNLSNVLEAIEFLGTEGRLAHKQIVFSTVGDRRAFERLPQGAVKPALVLSLHTTRPDLRSRLLPRAPRIEPAELAEAYAQATHYYPIQYQWTLLEGVNDGEDEIQGIRSLLKGKRAILNLIPYNTVPELDFTRPHRDRAFAMSYALNGMGIMTRIRQSAGQDVEGGCGQLRARVLAESGTNLDLNPLA